MSENQIYIFKKIARQRILDINLVSWPIEFTQIMKNDFNFFCSDKNEEKKNESKNSNATS